MNTSPTVAAAAAAAAAKVAASPSSTTSAAAKQPLHTPTDQAVLEYLKSKGMTSAVLELEKKLKPETGNEKGENEKPMTMREQLEHDDDVARNQRTALTKSAGGGYGYDRDAAAPIVQWGVPDNIVPGEKGASGLGQQEANAYLDAFCALQLWVLTLPDDPEGGSNVQQPKTQDVIKKARELISSKDKISLSSLITEISKSDDDNEDSSTRTTTTTPDSYFNLPPSAKPELLAVTFALLVHTYCELLEVGMETTAHVLRDAFSPIYKPIYEEQLKDLFHCTTTEDIVKLNTYNSQHMEALASLKNILIQVAQLQNEKDKYLTRTARSNISETQRAAVKQECDQKLALLQQKHNEASQRASQWFDRMYELPFLRRARAVRWQLTLSTNSYGLLASFLNNTTMQSSLLAMSTLLQTKCELHVERRDPLPFTPALVLDEHRSSSKTKQSWNTSTLVNWAAPVPRKDADERPFPKWHLDDEYDDEKKAAKDKKVVEFNRAILVNGFRRLEALERKREFEVMSDDTVGGGRLADPLKPSVLLSTLCTNSNSQNNGYRRSRSNSVSGTKSTTTIPESLWEESGIGLTCAKLCPPDGRRVAVGCDDSAIRIWDLKERTEKGDACQVLLGHKNGFPVFDLSWNKDGRSLLSSGGDGSIRLWDTMAQGPFGEVTKPDSLNGTKKTTEKLSAKQTNAAIKETLTKATKNLDQAKTKPDMMVPGLKPESSLYQSGAALAVYRGHAPNTPVWSVAFAPCGYYFASAGADATARLWTTDRPAPVRLFTGHTSNSVHSIVFHPNCNYVLTGSEDKTARLWDIQTGRCVRLLNGCPGGIHRVEIDPSGQYAAGADATGIIHLWDLGTGKKVTEFRSKMDQEMTMIHSLSFSACGTALASGGDDRCVRIWDVKTASSAAKPIFDTPVKSFSTRRTLLMDLHYTKRNLLLSVGKYITPAQTVNTISD